MSGYWKRFTSVRISRRRILGGAAGLGLGAVTASIVGCAGDNAGSGASGEDGPPVYGGTIRFGGWGVRLYLSPRGATGGNYMDQDWVTGDSYVYVKADGSFDSSLSLWERWQQPDKQTIIATLRRGVKFHDGTPFDAESVKAHLEYMSVASNVPHYGFFSLLENFERVTVTDEHTVVIRSKQPDASFLSIFAMIPGVPFSLAQVQKLGDDELTRPAQTGPFIVDSYTPQVGWQWVKNRNYWGAREGAPPYPDRIDYQGPADHNVRAAALEAGDFDAVWFGSSDANTKRLSQDPRFQNRALSVAPMCLNINQALPPLNDLRVRQALASAVDRQKVVDLVYRGQGTVAKTGLLPPNTFGALEYEKYPFDLRQAKQYLDASGVRTPVKLQYIYSGAGTEEILLSSQIYQETMRQIGIEIELVNQPSAGLAGSMFRNGEIHLTHGSPGVRPDPVAQYNLYAASYGSLNPGGKLNDTAQQRVDDLIRRAQEEFDTSKRLQIFHDLHRTVVDNVIGVVQVAERIRWLFANSSIGGMSNPEVVNAPGGAGYRLRLLWKKG